MWTKYFFQKKKYFGNINDLSRIDENLLNYFKKNALEKNKRLIRLGEEELSKNDSFILLAITNTILNICSQILYEKESYAPRKICVYANKSPKINAYASISNNNYYRIGINIGSIHYIYKLVLYLFSKKEFMRAIGNSNSENKKNCLIQGYSYEQIPSCSVRLKYAGDVTILSMIVFFYHELAHILRGHLEYISSKYNANIISDGENDNMDMERRKALECDADYYSGFFLGLTYRNEKKLFKDIFDSDNSVDFFKSCTLAAKLSFHSFEKKSQSKNYHLPKTRLEIFLEGLTKSLQLEKVALENAVGVIVGIENAFEHFNINLGNSPQEIEKDGKEFYAKTTSLWSELEKELLIKEPRTSQ